jgi:hypothetical protein
MTIGERISAWLRRRPRPTPGSRGEFEAACQSTRSGWIKSLIESPLFNENVPSRPYDVMDISTPRKRTGRLFIKDMLRLEQMIRAGRVWRGGISAMGDAFTRALYPEEYARLVAELRETCGVEPPRSGGGLTVVEVQQTANALIDAARKAQR